jgi:hypothetical protein
MVFNYLIDLMEKQSEQIKKLKERIENLEKNI